MDGIELSDFATKFDSARAKDHEEAVPVRYSGHLLLPGDDVVISLQADGLVLSINGQLASTDHAMNALAQEYGFLIRRALRRNLGEDAIRSDIIRWHENGDDYAFEPYLVRTAYLRQAANPAKVPLSHLSVGRIQTR